MEDALAIFTNYASDTEVTQFLPWRPHKSVEDTKRFLTLLLKAIAAGATFAWVIEGNPDRRLMGLTSLNVRSAREDLLAGPHEQVYKVDFAYHLARKEWGQGYAPEAAGALVHWALAQPTIYRIWTTCDVDNTRSIRVLEKLGLEREGTLRSWLVHPNISAAPRDALCFALVK